MLNLERMAQLTAELSTNLLKSLVLPIPGLSRRQARLEERNGDLILSPQGTLVLLGGGPLVDDTIVELIHLAGGRKAEILILRLGAAAEVAEGVAHRFRRFGLDKITSLSGAEADAPTLEAADLIYLLADEPEAALAALQGPVLLPTLARLYNRGKTLVGAGPMAGLVCEEFLIPSDEGPRLVNGLGLVERVLFAGQFELGDRYAALITAVGQHLDSSYLGVGVAGTAGVVIKGGEVRVIGEGAVLCLDPRDAYRLPEESAAHPAEAELPADSVVDQLCGLRLHLLVPGFGLNLKNRRPVRAAQFERALTSSPRLKAGDS